MLFRLHETIAAIAPIYGVAQDRIDFKPEATAEQITTAQVALAAFDWSEQAHALWLENRNLEKRDLHAMATAHIADLDTIIRAGSFTNAQRDNALKKLAQGQKAIIKRLVQLQ